MSNRWHVILRDDKRYGFFHDKAGLSLYPEHILVFGTDKQAQHIADTLSFDKPGCDDLFYVKDTRSPWDE